MKKFNPYWKPSAPSKPQEFFENWITVEKVSIDTWSEITETARDFLNRGLLIFIEDEGSYGDTDLRLAGKIKEPKLNPKYKKELEKYKTQYEEYKKDLAAWKAEKAKLDKKKEDDLKKRELAQLEILKKKYEK